MLVERDGMDGDKDADGEGCNGSPGIVMVIGDCVREG